MSLMLYPYTEDTGVGTVQERLEQLAEAAERYRAAVLANATRASESAVETRVHSPKEITISYNWDVIAAMLREVREMPEASKQEKELKQIYLTRLAEIYEVLRGAKMPKLEAVRLALASEASQLGGGTSGAPKVA